MFVLTYRTAAGSLRVAPRALDNVKVAQSYAKAYSRHLARTVSILDVTPLVEAAEDAMSWQDKGWYCQHSYEFCTPCFAGYDHPAEEDRVTEWIEANSAPSDTTGLF